MNQPPPKLLDQSQWQGTFIEKFIDKPHTFDFDGYDHSMTPIGSGERTSLILGRDGSLHLTIEEYDPYSGYLVISNVVVRGQWELRSLQEDRLLCACDTGWNLVCSLPTKGVNNQRRIL